MSSWYFVKDGQRNGPMRREELDVRVAEGLVNGDTLVWRPGMAAWEKACQVADLGLPPPLPSSPPEPPAMPAASPMPREPFASAAEAPLGRVAVRGQVYAGFWIRFAAKLIDGAVLYGIGTLVERVVVALAFDGVAPVPPDWEGVWRMLMYSSAINTVIGLAYSVYFMAKHEATPGKRILGLRVVRADGGRVETGRVIGRYFAEAVSTITFFAGYVMAAFDDEKRTLHDYMCDTRVVRGPRVDSRWDELRR